VGVLLIWAVIVSALLVSHLYEEDTKTSTPTSRVLITAAHVGAIEGYTCIYTDLSSDYAVHIKQDYSAEPVPVDGIVSLVGTQGKIVYSSPTEFAVEVADVAKIVPGCSGSPIYYNGVPIGFLSGWNGDGYLRCIYY